MAAHRPNEIEVAETLRAEMHRIRPTLPSDIDMRLVWDGTMFMRDALEEISKTLGETMLIVAIAVFVFLGSDHAAMGAGNRQGAAQCHRLAGQAHRRAVRGAVRRRT